MKIVRSVAAVVLGYILVVLVTEFGFRLFPGGRAPRHAGFALTTLATLIAMTAGFTGGYVAATLTRFRPFYAALLVALPLTIESLWLLTTRSRPGDLPFEIAGAVTLIGSTVAGGAARELLQRRHRAV
jgi:hypothetical protein